MAGWLLMHVPVYPANINNHAWIPSTLCNKSDPSCKHLLEDNARHCSGKFRRPLSNYGNRFDECQSTTWALWAHANKLNAESFIRLWQQGHWTTTCQLQVKFARISFKSCCCCCSFFTEESGMRGGGDPFLCRRFNWRVEVNKNLQSSPSASDYWISKWSRPSRCWNCLRKLFVLCTYLSGGRVDWDLPCPATERQHCSCVLLLLPWTDFLKFALDLCSLKHSTST